MNRFRTRTRSSLLPGALTAIAGVWLATPAFADPFFFSTGTADGLLGAFSQPAITSHLETEAADDFILTTTTSISQATIVGLVQRGTPLADITNVEVEIYHVFPGDSAEPPSGNAPSRTNSPGDVEIDAATRDGSAATLTFEVNVLDQQFAVLNSVADEIHKVPDNRTLGEGPASGQRVQITIEFSPPIVLPPDHYFFRPEVEVPGGFLYLSAPRPIVAPGTPFTGDLQTWIRNSDLKPDWLRIGTDIIGGDPVVTFNMTFSLSGDTVDPTATPTATPTPTSTDTPEQSTSTPTDTETPEPPTATPTSTATSPPPTATLTTTATPEPATATPTQTRPSTATATRVEATVPPTATRTPQPSSDGGSGCSLAAEPSANTGMAWLLLAPAAILGWQRRRRG